MLIERVPSGPEGGPAVVARDSRQKAAAGHKEPVSNVALQPVIALESGVVRGLKAVLGGGASETRLLELACVEARYWPGCRITVEVSPPGFATDLLLERVDAALAASGLAPWLLELAGTAAAPLAALRALRARGVGVVFAGSGANAPDLDRLRKWPWTAVKLEPELVHGLPFSPHAQRAGTLVEAAHALGLRSIADGLETLIQRDMLLRLGCDEATGPLYGRPMPSERLAQLLDYRVDTCPRTRRASETRDDRAVPHRSENPGAD